MELFFFCFSWMQIRCFWLLCLNYLILYLIMIKRNEKLNSHKIKTKRKKIITHIGYDGAVFIKSLKRIRKIVLLIICIYYFGGCWLHPEYIFANIFDIKLKIFPQLWAVYSNQYWINILNKKMHSIACVENSKKKITIFWHSWRVSLDFWSFKISVNLFTEYINFNLTLF